MTAGSDFQTGQNVLTTGAQVDDTMLLPIDTGGAEVASVRADALAAYVASKNEAVLPFSKVTTFDGLSTITVGGLTGAQIPCLTITGTVAPFTMQLPTAADLAAAAVAAGVAVGEDYQLRIANLRSTTGIGTLTANTGVTLSGLSTLTGVNSYGTWNVTITSLAAVTLTRVG